MVTHKKWNLRLDLDLDRWSAGTQYWSITPTYLTLK